MKALEECSQELDGGFAPLVCDVLSSLRGVLVVTNPSFDMDLEDQYDMLNSLYSTASKASTVPSVEGMVAAAMLATEPYASMMKDMNGVQAAALKHVGKIDAARKWFKSLSIEAGDVGFAGHFKTILIQLPVWQMSVRPGTLTEVENFIKTFLRQIFAVNFGEANPADKNIANTLVPPGGLVLLHGLYIEARRVYPTDQGMVMMAQDMHKLVVDVSCREQREHFMEAIKLILQKAGTLNDGQYDIHNDDCADAFQEIRYNLNMKFDDDESLEKIRQLSAKVTGLVTGMAVSLDFEFSVADQYLELACSLANMLTGDVCRKLLDNMEVVRAGIDVAVAQRPLHDLVAKPEDVLGVDPGSTNLHSLIQKLDKMSKVLKKYGDNL